MKALSGYPQWFWLMLQDWHNRKDVENRSWKLPMHIWLPQRIYLHGSKHLESSENLRSAMRLLTFVQVDIFSKVDWKQYQGTIMGEIDIIDCSYRFPDENSNPYSAWHIPGQYGFKTANPKLYDKPIPMLGHLGFWEVNLPEGTNVHS